MIYRSKAPLRLGLAGGGTDVSPYSDIYGGLILNATISLNTYCTIEILDSPEIIIESNDTQYYEVLPLLPQLEINGKGSLIKGVYNNIVRNFGPINNGFKISTYNDAPVGSGLGTSSSMVISILKAFSEWQNIPLGDYELSRLAYEIERIDLAFMGGKQDQYSAAFGGFNFMEFLTDGLVIVNPLKVKRWIIDELEASMVLYYTGVSRFGANIIKQQIENTQESDKTAIEAMHRLKEDAINLKRSLLTGNISEVAEILGKSWENKKKMAQSITNPKIDEIFEIAKKNGATGGKVSGAGGGGSIIFMVDPVNKYKLIEALNKNEGKVIPFQFTDGGVHGWRIDN